MNKILIVDDSNYMRFNLKKIIHKYGNIAFKEVQNGREALEAVQNQSFDLILMDITMPVMDGVEASGAILSINPEQKIVMVSSEGHDQTMARCVEIGICDFVVKPFNEAQVMAILEKHFPRQEK